MLKLIVTGGAGFIGSEFVRQGVSKGYPITVIDKLSYAGDKERLKEVEKDIAFLKIDIADRAAVDVHRRRFRVDRRWDQGQHLFH